MDVNADVDPPSTYVSADDADGDGLVAEADCDDLDPYATARADDKDCDGVTTRWDCDDADPQSPVVATDMDCDGEDGIAGETIPAGSFRMGCIPGVTVCDDGELPIREVTLTRDFWMGRTEITQAVFTAVMGYNPSRNVACGGTCPAESMSWHEAVAFANAVSHLEGRTPCYRCEGRAPWVGCTPIPDVTRCEGYRLSTEAEWEFAARCGTFHPHAGGSEPARVAWYLDNSGGATQPVATLRSNACGLFDLSGNVYEMTGDWFAPYPSDAEVDPEGPTEGARRVGRGGSVGCSPVLTQVTQRFWGDPASTSGIVGLRLARTLSP